MYGLGLDLGRRIVARAVEQAEGDVLQGVERNGLGLVLQDLRDALKGQGRAVLEPVRHRDSLEVARGHEGEEELLECRAAPKAMQGAKRDTQRLRDLGVFGTRSHDPRDLVMPRLHLGNSPQRRALERAGWTRGKGRHLFLRQLPHTNDADLFASGRSPAPQTGVSRRCSQLWHGLGHRAVEQGEWVLRGAARVEGQIWFKVTQKPSSSLVGRGPRRPAAWSLIVQSGQ